MTVAVLLGSPHAAAPLVLDTGKPLPDHLLDQLRRAGADEVVTADLAGVAELARTADQPMLLCSDDLVAHTAVLRHLATSPVGPTVALVLPDATDAGCGAADGYAQVREERGRITGVAAGASTGVFGGALRVGVADLPALAAAAQSVATRPATPVAAPAGTPVAAPAGTPAAPPAAGPAGTSVAAPAVESAVPGSPLDRLLGALAGTGTTIFAHRVRLLVARRVTDRSGLLAAEAAVAAVDSDAAELRLSVKEKDDFFTTYFVSTWSPHLTRLAARLGLGPTQVTAISVLFAVAAAVLFGIGGRPALVAGAVLLYLGFVLDCVDGQLARYTRRFSAWGGWLDTMADRAKEYAVYAGLAVGIERAGLGNGWALAIAALVLQTVRHMTDAWYGALHDEATRRPTAAGGSGGGSGGGLGDRLSRASNRVQAETGSLSYWLKRTVVFPIGERWALIALTVALFNPLVSLIAVLAWAGVAAGYTAALRGVRAWSMRVPVLTTVDAPVQRDDGVLARGLGRAVGRRWSRPGPLPLALLGALASAVLLGAGTVGVGAGATGAGWRWVVPVVALLVLAAGLPSAAPHTGPLDWLVPAALRATEYLFVIVVWRLAAPPAPLVFALLFVLALHHYDLTARMEKRLGRAPRPGLALGWDVRVALLALAASLPSRYMTVIIGLLCVYLLLGFLVSALTGWVKSPSSDRRGPRTPGVARAAGARVIAQRTGGRAGEATAATSGPEDAAHDPDQLRRTGSSGAGIPA